MSGSAARARAASGRGVIAQPPRYGPLAWSGVVLLCLSALLAGLLETLLTPLYIDGHRAWLAVLAAVVSNIALPLLSRNLVPTLLGTGLPVLAWLVVVIGFGVYARPEGDVILPAGPLQLVSYGVLLGGALAGVVTVVTAAPARPPRTAAQDGSVR